jgi:hypothetical protein
LRDQEAGRVADQRGEHRADHDNGEQRQRDRANAISIERHADRDLPRREGEVVGAGETGQALG